MKIELRKVSISTRMSEETLCFAAMVALDGVVLGEVRNDGRGGSHRYSTATLQQRLREYAKTLPDIVDDTLRDPRDPSRPFSYAQDEDSVINAAVADYQIRKTVRSMVSKKIVMAGQDGLVYTIGKSMAPAALAAQLARGEAALLADMKGRYARCLNFMAEDEIVLTYRRALGGN